ncbi:MAG: hypothetical protein IJ087_10340 [Eggerthellaceae bacterium]|nr:hypothetical protein [Eggerthellaceae bacterium]
MYDFKATRQGETERVCEKCGMAYQPTSRTQKYCPDCRKQPMKQSEDRADDGGKARVKEARKTMDANVFALNEAMFRELDRIEACGTAEEIEMEGARADRVYNLAANIIDNGKLMLRAAQMSANVAESVEVPRALLGMGDGR